MQEFASVCGQMNKRVVLGTGVFIHLAVRVARSSGSGLVL
jgi:hypothetical protein